MANRHFITACVSAEAKAKVRSLAQRQYLSESTWLKRLVWLAIRSAGEPDAHVLKSPARRLRGTRVCLRLHPDDLALLRQRAAARQMPAATYVSAVVRGHLRDPPE